jgi:hypothetical protein
MFTGLVGEVFDLVHPEDDGWRVRYPEGLLSTGGLFYVSNKNLNRPGVLPNYGC